MSRLSYPWRILVPGYMPANLDLWYEKERLRCWFTSHEYAIAAVGAGITDISGSWRDFRNENVYDY